MELFLIQKLFHFSFMEQGFQKFKRYTLITGSANNNGDNLFGQKYKNVNKM